MVIELGQIQNRNRANDQEEDTPTIDGARNTYKESKSRLGASPSRLS